ncbi:unnamed protein product [Closterium sp. NIES-65]|nr:unnamed protein product [Closterium sp. NIES-65]
MEVSRAIALNNAPPPPSLHLAPLQRRAASDAAGRGRSSGLPSLSSRPLRTSLCASRPRLPVHPALGECRASGPRGSGGAQPGEERPWGAQQAEGEKEGTRVGGGRREGVVVKARGGGAGDGGAGAGQDNDGLDAVLAKVVWAGFGLYMLWLFVLPFAPGDPAWRISEGTVQEVRDLSLNFFYILPALNAAGIHVLEAPQLHPVAEALFNVVNAWSLLFGPLLLADPRRTRVGANLPALWLGQMFLTNVFLIPIMALRLRPPPPPHSATPLRPAAIATFLSSAPLPIALVSSTVALASLFWAALARPNFAPPDLTVRAAFLADYLGSNRLAYAFAWDVLLYSLFQPWLIADCLSALRRSRPAEAARGDEGGTTSGDYDALLALLQWVRFVPLFGLAAFLCALPRLRATSESQGQDCVAQEGPLDVHGCKQQGTARRGRAGSGPTGLEETAVISPSALNPLLRHPLVDQHPCHSGCLPGWISSPRVCCTPAASSTTPPLQPLSLSLSFYSTPCLHVHTTHDSSCVPTACSSARQERARGGGGVGKKAAGA